MAEDSTTREYMNHIRKNPKFIPGGQMDGEGFYNQQDGSFFDPEGYYFDAAGRDELGGYYDESGVYCEPEDEILDDGYGEELPMAYGFNDIEAAAPGTVFYAQLSNLWFKATKEQIENELKRMGVAFTQVDLERDHEDKLQHVHVTMKSKDAAKALLNLKGKDFMRRPLRVDLEAIETEMEGEVVPPPAAPKVEAPKAEVPKPAVTEEKKPAPAKKGSETPVTAPGLEAKSAVPAEKPKEEEKKVAIPQDNVWALSAEDLQSVIKPAGITTYDAKKKPAAAKSSAPTKASTTNKQTAKPAGKTVKGKK